MKGDDIAARLLEFSVRIVRLTVSLPKSLPGKHVAGQILRSATSAGANYEEARGGQTLPDFVHKLAIAWKELRETCYWLKIIQRAELVSPTRVSGLLTEAGELTAILGASVITAKKRKRDPENE